jgi:hypothetical protein
MGGGLFAGVFIGTAAQSVDAVADRVVDAASPK